MKRIEDELLRYRKSRKTESSEIPNQPNLFKRLKTSLCPPTMSDTSLSINSQQSSCNSNSDSPLDNSDKWTRLDVIILICKILLYIVLQTLAVMVEFGSVFFAISLLYFIFTNLRTRQKLKGEPSAYSVFNENCQPITGTLDAETLQRQQGLSLMF